MTELAMDAGRLHRDLTINVSVNYRIATRIRVRLGLWLFVLGARVAGVGIKLDKSLPG